jgi:hypothetical protein
LSVLLVDQELGVIDILDPLRYASKEGSVAFGSDLRVASR